MVCHKVYKQSKSSALKLNDVPKLFKYLSKTISQPDFGVKRKSIK